MIKNIFILLIANFFSSGLFSQAPDSLIQARSTRMSDLFRDSLQLNNDEYINVKRINYQLLRTKTTIMLSDTTQSAIQRQVQKVENSRDSLYRGVLSPDKYSNYLRLKFILLSVQ
jgi:uncharacterized protein Yka (UPF0111/DUF47 family)